MLLSLIPCLLVGFWIGGRHPDLSGRLALPLVRFGVPLSVMGLLLKGGLSGQMLQAALLAAAAIGVMLVVGARVPPLRRLLPGPCSRLGSCVGNTAYVGIPLALAFLPASALPISIGYDLGATLLTWSVGPMLIAAPSPREGGRAIRLLMSLTASPAVRGLAGALLVQWTPWRAGVAEAMWIPSQVVILLALAVVGLRLGSIARDRRAPGPLAASVAPVLLAKLIVYPLLLLSIGLLLRLDPLMIQALTLQGAAPAAISLLLIAESAGRDQDLAAGLVLWSTVCAALTAPIWGVLVTILFNQA